MLEARFEPTALGRSAVLLSALAARWDDDDDDDDDNESG
jgi:hypothetical protein